jgi:hypothetical protein
VKNCEPVFFGFEKYDVFRLDSFTQARKKLIQQLEERVYPVWDIRRSSREVTAVNENLAISATAEDEYEAVDMAEATYWMLKGSNW